MDLVCSLFLAITAVWVAYSRPFGKNAPHEISETLITPDRIVRLHHDGHGNWLETWHARELTLLTRQLIERERSPVIAGREHANGLSSHEPAGP